MTTRRRRPPGEGSVFEYQASDGTTQFGIKFELPAGGRPASGDAPPRSRTASLADPRGCRDALREAVVKVRQGRPGSSRASSRWPPTWRRGSTGCGWRRAPWPDTGRTSVHVMPYIGALPLASLTSARLTALYRELETSGHRDQKGERTGSRCPRAPSAAPTMLGAALGRRARGRGSAAGPQPGREGQAAHRQGRRTRRPRRCTRGPPTSSACSWTGRATTARCTRPGTCSPIPACAAASCLRCAGVISISTRPRSASAARSASSASRGSRADHREGGDQDVQAARDRPRPGDRRRPARVEDASAVPSPCSSPGTARSCSATSRAVPAARAFLPAVPRQQARCARMLGEDAPPAIRLHDLRHRTRRSCCGPARTSRWSASGSGTPA